MEVWYLAGLVAVWKSSSRGAMGGQCCVKPAELRLSDGALCLYL